MKINGGIVMKVFFSVILMMSIGILACAQGTGEGNNQTPGNGNTSTLYLHIGQQVLTAALTDNSSTAALKELLAGGPLTIEMSDYGGFEKVGSFGRSLPRNDTRITAGPGDLILYQGNSFVIFYGSNAWSYTRLGKINGVSQSELRNILGSGNVTVTLSLNQ
jgi:hypothetical protein